jgi:hypothetical protein
VLRAPPIPAARQEAKGEGSSTVSVLDKEDELVCEYATCDKPAINSQMLTFPVIGTKRPLHAAFYRAKIGIGELVKNYRENRKIPALIQ